MANELKFIEFRENISINGISIPAGTRLPALVGDEVKDLKKGADIDKQAVVAGMLEALKKKLKNENLAFYKKVLLADRLLLERLRTASKVKGASEEISDSELNVDILASIKVLDNSEISYINFVRGLINAIHLAEEEDKTDRFQDELFSVLKEGLELYPESYSLLFHMADYHKNAGNYENARKYSERLRKIDMGSASQEQLVKLENEIETLEKNEEEILYIYDLISMEREDEALEKSSKFLKKNPDNWHVLMLQGWAYRIKEQFEKAEESILSSIKHGGGDFAENYNELSLCEWALDKKELAVQYAEMAYELDTSSLTYLGNISMMYLDMKKYVEARKFLFEACEIDEEDEIVNSLIARLEKESGIKFEKPSVCKRKLKESGSDEDKGKGHKHSSHSCDDDGCDCND